MYQGACGFKRGGCQPFPRKNVLVTGWYRSWEAQMWTDLLSTTLNREQQYLEQHRDRKSASVRHGVGQPDVTC